MSTLFMDSFDQYGSGSAGQANMLDGIYANLGTAFTVGVPYWGPARTGPNCLIMTPFSIGRGVQNELRYVIPTTPANLFMSFGFAVDSLPPGTILSIWETRDNSNNPQYSLVLNPTGSLSLYSGAGVSGTLIGTTTGPVIRAQTWHFIELNCNYTAGTFTVRVDDAQGTGSPALTEVISTGLVNSIWAATWSSTAGSIYGNCYYDDVFIRSDAGTINNSWLGDRRVALLLVDADTLTAGWTPSFYKKFGTGVLACSTLATNTNTPLPSSVNTGISFPGNSSVDVGSSDFTMETFVRFEQLPARSTYATLFSRWDAANNYKSYRFVYGGPSFNNNSFQFDYTIDGTTVVTPLQFPFIPVLNQWYHIAIVRASNELLLFINGQQMGVPISITASIFGGTTSPFCIGAEKGTAGTPVSNTGVVGMFDETRFTNGYARYVAPFSPPVAALPRGNGSDAYWSDVVFIASYDTSIIDESSFNQNVTPMSTSPQAFIFLPTDGPAVGTYSTINKAIPDDNTFISAGLLNATGVLTMTTQPANGDTVTVGTKNGSTAAVYTWKNALSTAFDVLIDTTAENSLLNLYNAINGGAGAGTKYGTGTIANYDVTATQLPVGQIQAVAVTPGTAGNSVATSATGTAASWGGTTLSGGANIPGPSAFKINRPPPNTTIISALQATVRAAKSDSGTANIQMSLIGPLGGVTNGAIHNLALSPDFYADIIELDPDTGLQVTPSTVVSGKLQVNRTA
jgi:hypothetical protein